MQKITYLLPTFGIDIDFSIDSYSWYLHGPCSPQLTRTLFDIVENANEAVAGRLTQKDVKKIEKLKTFLEDVNSVNSLELLVALHFLLNQAKKYGTKTDDVIEILKEKKPYFNNQEILHALRKIRMIL